VAVPVARRRACARQGLYGGAGVNRQREPVVLKICFTILNGHRLLARFSCTHFATNICNMASPLFTGLSAMVHILPFVKRKEFI
jgi:hypothetical protein